MKIVALIAILTIGLSFFSGCLTIHERAAQDETGKGVRIGLVNTDPIYLRNVDLRIETTVSYLRLRSSIFYQPTPEIILALNYVSLSREVFKIGLRQPGMDIDERKFERLLLERAEQEAEIYFSKFEDGATFFDIAEEFNLATPESQLISVGDIKEWYKAIEDLEVGDISDVTPVVLLDYAYIFKILEKGEFDDGHKWFNALMLAFPLRVDEVEKELQNEIAQRWDISFSSRYHDAIYEYFRGNVSEGYEILYDYLQREGASHAMAHFFMARILQKKYEKEPDDALLGLIISHLEQAIQHNTNIPKIPHFYYELASFYENTSSPDKALEYTRKAIDTARDDLPLLRELIVKVEGKDNKYYSIVQDKIHHIEEQIRSETISRVRAIERTGRVMTGEGFLHECNDEILEEMQQALDAEKHFDYLQINVRV